MSTRNGARILTSSPLWTSTSTRISQPRSTVNGFSNYEYAAAPFVACV